MLRTLINVGDLGPGERRWPTDEEYPLADYRYVTDLLRHGRPYVSSIDDDDADPAATALLEELGKESQLAVPVMFQGAMWGELWATGADGRRFGADDVRVLAAIAAQVSVAIGRAELFDEMSRFAYEDPLTRLANRRRLDECLEELCRHGDPTLLICDVDGLKDINDRDGHPVGDAVLQAVAGVLSDVASGFRAALVARLGGDEFCLVLTACPSDTTEELVQAVGRRIVAEVGRHVSLCWGVAANDSTLCSPHELIGAADAALVQAKRLGRGRVRLHEPGAEHPPSGPGRRLAPRLRSRHTDYDLIARFVTLCDESRPAGTVAALELLAVEVCRFLDAAAWTISKTTDYTELRSIRGVESRLDRGSGLRMVLSAQPDAYPLAEYPASAEALHECGTFVAADGLDGSDHTEVALLQELGYRAVLGIGTADRDHGYLLEIYSDGDPAELAAVAPHARVLARYCSGGSWMHDGR